MPNDRDSVFDIISACRRAMEYASGKSFDDLRDDLMLQDAIIRRIEVIGEATKRLSEPFRVTNPTVPWQQMAGMRDRLIHGYDKVDVERVWSTVNAAIPSVLPELERVFNSLSEE